MRPWDCVNSDALPWYRLWAMQHGIDTGVPPAECNRSVAASELVGLATDHQTRFAARVQSIPNQCWSASVVHRSMGRLGCSKGWHVTLQARIS